jgi:hypothetical protein
MSTEHNHDDEHSDDPDDEDVAAKQPRHSLASAGGQPGMWTTWEDVPLVLKIVELAEVRVAGDCLRSGEGRLDSELSSSRRPALHSPSRLGSRQRAEPVGLRRSEPLW